MNAYDNKLYKLTIKTISEYLISITKTKGYVYMQTNDLQKMLSYVLRENDMQDRQLNNADLHTLLRANPIFECCQLKTQDGIKVITRINPMYSGEE